MVGLAPAREGGVAPLLAERWVGEHECAVDGRALGGVAGDRVAVRQRRIALAGRGVEEVGAEGDAAAGDVELEPAPLATSTPTTIASLAVADAEADVVLTDQDVVADGEAAGAELELVGAERASGSHPLARPRVEIGDVDAAERDHHGRRRVAGGPPVGGEALARGVLVGLDDEAVVGAVGGDRLLPTPGAQVLDGLALPGVALAPVLGELDGEPAAGERAERAAGVDRGELAVVADQDELAARRLDVVEHRRELSRPGHAGLVDDEHDPAREPLARVRGRRSAARG